MIFKLIALIVAQASALAGHPSSESAPFSFAVPGINRLCGDLSTLNVIGMGAVEEVQYNSSESGDGSTNNSASEVDTHKDGDLFSLLLGAFIPVVHVGAWVLITEHIGTPLDWIRWSREGCECPSCTRRIEVPSKEADRNEVNSELKQ